MDRAAIKTALDDMFPAVPADSNAPEFVIEEMNGLLQRNNGAAVMICTFFFTAKPATPFLR